MMVFDPFSLSRYLKACRTLELSAELTVTRGYWLNQNPPRVRRNFFVTRAKNLSKLYFAAHGGNLLTPISRVTVSSADSSRVRQA